MRALVVIAAAIALACDGPAEPVQPRVHGIIFDLANTTQFVVGDTATQRVLVVDSAGQQLSGRQVAFASSNAAVVTIDPATGLMSAKSGGSATITATADGVSATRDVTVTGVVVAFANASAPCLNIAVGQTCLVSAQVRTAQGFNLVTSRYADVIVSADPGIATVRMVPCSNVSGVRLCGEVTGVRLGQTTLSATYTGANGVAITTTAQQLFPVRVN